jgi:glycosyltransferase involved in cell wall biosynthesis
MKSLPSVSIALCTFNGEPFLRRQLESFSQQTVLPAELVVSDDRSTDETVDILTSFARDAPFDVRLLVNPVNLGSTKNFERALAECRSELIALSDQDDVWHPSKIERTVKEFCEAPETGLVFTDARIVGAGGEPYGYGVWEAQGFTKREIRTARRGGLVDVLFRHDVATGATMVLRRAMLERLLPIPSEWVHDAWIALISACLAPAVAVDEALIDYRQHGKNQIGSRKVSMREQILRSAATPRSRYRTRALQFDQAAERLREFPPSHRYRRVVDLALAKSRHLRARADLPSAILARTTAVAKELASGRYHRFGDGWWSAAKDLLS